MKSLAAPANRALIATLAVCVLLYVLAAVVFRPTFCSLQVLVNFLADNAFLGIIAVGMTLVIISGGIDLSVGAVMALCSVVLAVLMHNRMDPRVAIMIVLPIGSALGFVMGCIVHHLKMAPFIVTLAGMFLARGLAQTISVESLPIQNHFYDSASRLGIPLPGTSLPITAVIFLVMVGIGVYITVFTPFGRNLYAIGWSEDAALLMGLPVGRTKVLVYTFSGFCASLAAVVYTFYQSSGSAVAGVGLELDAIAVVVIGGTLLTGGAGSVIGTLIGTLIFGIIQTAITFQGTLSSWWTRVFIGFLLLAFILLQKLLSPRERASG